MNRAKEGRLVHTSEPLSLLVIYLNLGMQDESMYMLVTCNVCWDLMLGIIVGQLFLSRIMLSEEMFMVVTSSVCIYVLSEVLENLLLPHVFAKTSI